MTEELVGIGNHIHSARRSVQRERAIERIAHMLPVDLEESYVARRDFGPEYGFANSLEWWETEKRKYNLTDEYKPSWVVSEFFDDEDAGARDYQDLWSVSTHNTTVKDIVKAVGALAALVLPVVFVVYLCVVLVNASLL